MTAKCNTTNLQTIFLIDCSVYLNVRQSWKTQILCAVYLYQLSNIVDLLIFFAICSTALCKIDIFIRDSCMRDFMCTGLCVLQSRPVESAGTQVLVLGLNGAGKTSLLYCWATGSLEQDVQPTQGFYAVSINREDLHIEFLESELELIHIWTWSRETKEPFLFEVSHECELFPCQLEVKRSCGRTGRSTCPRLFCWCLWSTPPAHSSSPSLRDIYTSYWPLTPACL